MNAPSSKCLDQRHAGLLLDPDAARPRRVPGACMAIVLGTLANAVAAPLIFAALLSRIAQLGPHAARGCAILRAPAGRLRARARRGHAVRPHRRLDELGRHPALVRPVHHQWLRPPDEPQPPWHTDRPSGEVIATLETSTWAFVELIDATVWGMLRIGVTTLGAIVVLGVVAWPVALVMAGLVGVFGLVLHRRMGKGRGGREAVLRRPLPGHRRDRRHDRQPHHGAFPGRGGEGDAARRRAGGRFDQRRPAGTQGLHHHTHPDGVGHGLLQLGRRPGGCRPGSAPRGRGRSGVPDPLLRHLCRHEPRGVLRVHPLDVPGHRPLRQVRRHRRHAARHRRSPRRARAWWCPGGSSSGVCGSPTAAVPRSSRGWTCASSRASTSGWSGLRVRARRR